MVNLFNLLSPLLRVLGIILIPVCIYLSISLSNYSKINKELTERVGELNMELGVERSNVALLRESIRKQNESILSVNNLYNTKNEFYSEWLSKDDLSKYGDKACDIFTTKDLDKKLELIKGFNIKK